LLPDGICLLLPQNIAQLLKGPRRLLHRVIAAAAPAAAAKDLTCPIAAAVVLTLLWAPKGSIGQVTLQRTSNSTAQHGTAQHSTAFLP
jgi:hypothetical protein